MARIRTIKPDFWTDEKVILVSAFARLLFIGLWNVADDDGRMEYSPLRLKMQLFPNDTLSVEDLVAELTSFDSPLVFVYEVENKSYLQVTNFQKHQKIDKRRGSKFPAPPECTVLPQLALTHADSPQSPETDPDLSQPAPSPDNTHQFPETDPDLSKPAPSRADGMEGNGREGKGTQTPMESSAVAAPIEKNLNSQLFDCGVRFLCNDYPFPEERIRRVLGNWIKTHGAGPVLEELMAAEKAQPVDPLGWLTAALLANRRSKAAKESNVKLIESLQA